MNLWWFDRRCEMARVLHRLASWMLQTSRNPTTVCVPSEDTIHDASIQRLTLECARRVWNGREAWITVNRQSRVLVAAIVVHDDETFDQLHAALKAELRTVPNSAEVPA